MNFPFDALVFIEFHPRQHCFPRHSTADRRSFFTIISSLVCLGTNNQHEIRPSASTLHPERPTFGWRPFNVLIDHAIYAILTKTIAEAKNTTGVLSRLMRVENEALGGAVALLAVNGSRRDRFDWTENELQKLVQGLRVIDLCKQMRPAARSSSAPERKQSNIRRAGAGQDGSACA
jgi:hypothetical protein